MLDNKKIDLINKKLEIKNNELYFHGYNIDDLADKYETPLYIMDEQIIREKCRLFKKAIKDQLDDNGDILYASKALSSKFIYRIIKEENLGIDVVSIGEIYTAKEAGFDLKKSFFHSNNKTDIDIEFAIDNNVGFFVIDNEEELYAIQKIANKKNVIQNVLIRITPGIDPHTYEKISTGKIDSKFGFSIETGLAEDIIKKTLAQNNIKLCGFHSHVGSQVFDTNVFFDTVDVMCDFINYIKNNYEYIPEILNLGGGFATRYIYTDKEIDIYKNVIKICEYVKNKFYNMNIKMPKLYFEPGRSIVADSGITIYTVGSVKKIPNYKNYISVDGGMGDNIRVPLYGVKYTYLPTKNVSDNFDIEYDIVGRFCESGDELRKNIKLPDKIKRGDRLVCLTTGAYQYSMASNYNRVPRPRVILINDNSIKEVIKKETLEDLIKLDI